MSGAELIAAERARGISEEGWTAEHDDEHKKGELLEASLSYQMMADGQTKSVPLPKCFIPKWWPFERAWWKPSPDPIRNLVIAGALLAAEIDRLQRLKEKQTNQPK